MKSFFVWLAEKFNETFGHWFGQLWEVLKDFLSLLYTTYTDGVSGWLQDQISSMTAELGGAAEWATIQDYLVAANYVVPVNEMFSGFALISTIAITVVGIRLIIKAIPAIGG